VFISIVVKRKAKRGSEESLAGCSIDCRADSPDVLLQARRTGPTICDGRRSERASRFDQTDVKFRFHGGSQIPPWMAEVIARGLSGRGRAVRR
jgi:hypothetical protein